MFKRTKLYINDKRQADIYLDNTAFEVYMYKAKSFIGDSVRFVFWFGVAFWIIWLALYITQGI